MRKFTLAAIAALILTLGSACAAEDAGSTSGGPQTNSGNTDNPPAKDVTITECGVLDASGWIGARGTIVNHSSKASTYFLSFEVIDAAGTRYGEGVFSSSAVAPDQSVEWEASAITEPREGSVCKVISVDRFAS